MRTFPVTDYDPKYADNSDLLNEISALQSIILEQDAKIRDLEAVQAKLAEMLAAAYYPESESHKQIIPILVDTARRECGIKEGGV